MANRTFRNSRSAFSCSPALKFFSARWSMSWSGFDGSAPSPRRTVADTHPIAVAIVFMEAPPTLSKGSRNLETHSVGERAKDQGDFLRASNIMSASRVASAGESEARSDDEAILWSRSLRRSDAASGRRRRNPKGRAEEPSLYAGPFLKELNDLWIRGLLCPARPRVIMLE